MPVSPGTPSVKQKMTHLLSSLQQVAWLPDSLRTSWASTPTPLSCFFSSSTAPVHASVQVCFAADSEEEAWAESPGGQGDHAVGESNHMEQTNVQGKVLLTVCSCCSPESHTVGLEGRLGLHLR